MRKTALLIFMLSMMASATSVALAGGYNSLKFTSDTGEIYTITTDNLEILIEGENLVFNNTDLSLPLATLLSMEFTDYSDETAGTDSMIIEPDAAVTVFDLNGVSIGSFDTYSEAISALCNGVFVIKDANGNSLKISVGK